MGKIFVLIPTHNRKSILCATIAKVRAQLPGEAARIVVVDAGSSDGTREAVGAQYSFVEIVSGNADMWWTATVQHGLDYIAGAGQAGDQVILMNDDIDLESGALTNLIEASLLRPRSVIGAINIVKRAGDEPRVYFCGGRYDLIFARHKANLPQGAVWRPPEERFFETDFLYGRLLIIPWESIQSGCRFDVATFPQYGADEDFAFDAKRRGFNVLMDSKAVVYVNTETTARFSLNIFKSGLRGILKALTAHNSYYNLRHCWAFARRYARWPALFVLCRYGIVFLNDNFRRPS